MVKDGSVSPASTGYSSDDRRAAFYRGEAAFMLDGPGAIAQAGDAAGKIGIVEPLVGKHGDKGTIFWVNNIMIYQQTQHPDEVKTFLKWWSKNQTPLWSKGKCGQIPARKSISADAYFTNNQPLSYVIANYIPTGKTTATNASGIFPALNDLEGEGVMQSFARSFGEGRPEQCPRHRTGQTRNLSSRDKTMSVAPQRVYDGIHPDAPASGLVEVVQQLSPISCSRPRWQ